MSSADIRVTMESGDDASGGGLDAVNRYAFVDLDGSDIELRVRVATSDMADKISKLFADARDALKERGR